MAKVARLEDSARVSLQSVPAVESRIHRAGGPSLERRGGFLARKPNYGHEKRQREKQRQQKKAEKADKKRLKTEEEETKSRPPEEDQDGEETE
jgi:hypothetical protein